ncbi:MAG: hypothetical protein IJT54_03700 [Candidatus Methanomethylophilaceae archaeon]|nr:hypothetical protein [Candidatus Methanomethylophilaceae archaeon]
MTDQLTGVYIGKNGVVGTVTVDNDMKSFYKLLDVNCIQMPRRRIGDQIFRIVYDEEALIRRDPVVTAIDPMGYPMVFNSLFIISDDEKGGFKSLTKSQCQKIMDYIRPCSEGDEVRMMLTNVSYR